MDVSKLHVLYDNVLVEGVIDEERGGIVRGISQDDKPEVGVVLAVGEGRIDDNGNLIKVSVKPGYKVLFNQYTTNRFNFNGKNYYTMRAEDVIGYFD